LSPEKRRTFFLYGPTGNAYSDFHFDKNRNGKNAMNPVFRQVQALSDPNRLRLLAALVEARPFCLCQAVALLRRAPSTVSAHLAALRRAGLVISEKRGRWHYYRLALPRGASTRWIRALLEAFRATESYRSDQRRLRVIMALEAEELCRRVFPKPSATSERSKGTP